MGVGKWIRSPFRASRLLPLASRLLPLASRLLPLASRLLPLASRLLPLASCLLLLSSGLLLLASCSASTAPVVKLGLVAPFEGRYRAIGYEAIYAARLAIREINQSGGVDGYRVELVALDDSGSADRAAEQARKLALDPQVVAVIGHYLPDTTAAAMGTYCDETLPLLAVESNRASDCLGVLLLTPPLTGSLITDSLLTDSLITDSLTTDPSSFLFAATVPHPAELPAARTFADAYNAIPIDGTRAGPIALQTYDAMHLLFDALARNIQLDGKPSREGMRRALAESDFAGLSGAYRFDAERNRVGARVYVYRYGKDRQPELVR